MSQTTTLTVPADGILGMLADGGESDIISRVAEGAVYLGLLAVFGTNQPSAGTPGQVKEIVNAAANVDDFAGIPIWESAKEPYTVANSKSQIADKKVVSLLRRGRIWVYVETAVTPASAPFVRVTAAGADVKGQFRAGTAANFVAFTNAKFITSTAGAGLAILEIR